MAYYDPFMRFKGYLSDFNVHKDQTSTDGPAERFPMCEPLILSVTKPRHALTPLFYITFH